MSELEASFLILSGPSPDLVETTRLEHRLMSSCREFEVQLCDFSAFDFAGVGDGSADFGKRYTGGPVTNSEVTGDKLVREELGLRYKFDLGAVPLRTLGLVNFVQNPISDSLGLMLYSVRVLTHSTCMDRSNRKATSQAGSSQEPPSLKPLPRSSNRRIASMARSGQ
jgi:hypothetical protein